jgi:hypothetical protein
MMNYSNVLTAALNLTSTDRADDEEFAQFYTISKWLNVILLTIIAFVGVYGNLMSIVIFSKKSFSKNSTRALKVNLILQSTIDLFILLLHYVQYTLQQWSHLLIPIEAINLVDKSLILCKLVPFTRSTLKTMSMYILINILLQRLVLFYRPRFNFDYFSFKFNLKLFAALLFFSLLVSAHFLFLNEPAYLDNHWVCDSNKQLVNFHFKIIILECALRVLLPFVAVLTLGAVLSRKLKYLKNLIGEEIMPRAANRPPEEESSFIEIQKYNNYLNSLNAQYPHIPMVCHQAGNRDAAASNSVVENDRLLIELSARVSRVFERSEASDFHLIQNLVQSLKLSYIVAVISKWCIVLYLPFLLLWLLSKLMDDYSLFDQTTHHKWRLLVRGMLNLFEIPYIFHYAVKFFIYLYHGESFRKRHKKLAFNVCQLAFYYLISFFSRLFCCRKK